MNPLFVKGFEKTAWQRDAVGRIVPNDKEDDKAVSHEPDPSTGVY